MVINVLSYLDAAKEQCPDAVAVADVQKSLTYGELWESASRAGSAIFQRLGDNNKPVIVCIKHNVEDVLAFYSIVYSGNFYVPVDMSLPVERITKMIEVVQPAAVISAEDSSTVFDGIPSWSVDELIATGEVCVSPWKERKDTDLLYVLFTSGSTGEPKGVSISHRAVIDMAEQFSKTFDFGPGTVFGNQAPFDFDVSVKDIYISARNKGRVEILENKLFSFPKLLIERFNERKINTIIWAVPAMNIVSALKGFCNEKPKYIKKVMFSGEIMPMKTLKYWMDELEGVQYVNLYGPTEITCNCTYHVVDSFEQLQDSVPIGKAFPNCSVFLVSGDGPVLEDGMIGEICVTGSCLSNGYYNRLDLTDKAFMQNVLNRSYPEKMYKTGDLAYRKDGLLYFMGRNDSQIKHMGHRIEMAEIVLCANSVDKVTSSVCVYDEERSKIVLFYQGEVEEGDLRNSLKGKMPKYMMPNVIKQIDTFPKTRTQKIDTKRLLKDFKENRL